MNNDDNDKEIKKPYMPNKRKTILEMKDLEWYAKHWKATIHLLNCILVVISKKQLLNSDNESANHNMGYNEHKTK